MTCPAELLKTSIGKKLIVALTGLVMMGFVVGHLAGNLQIFAGQNQINTYAEKLRHLGPLLWGVRFFLLASVLLHGLASLKLAQENRAARPVAYVHEDTVQATLASRTMVLSGIVLSAFIVYHLMHFTFRVTHPAFAHLKDSLGRHDTYSMMVLGFQNPYVSIFYIVGMGALCFHLSHGASSWAQTFGLTNAKCLACLKHLGNVFAVLIFTGYISIPVCVILNIIKLP